MKLRPEDLLQMFMTFEDVLLKATCNSISNEGNPSLENFVVLTWLKDIHAELPKLVKQRYGIELRSWTLLSIKPKVTLALNP